MNTPQPMDKITNLTELKIQKNEMIDNDNFNKLLNYDGLEQNARKSLNSLKSYCKTSKKDVEINVEYSISKDCFFNGLMIGRLYPSFVGLQKQRRDIRTLLCSRFYWDIDIENCHFNLIEQLCNFWNIPKSAHQHITFYNQNREECLNKISSNRDFSKLQFTKLMYGGIAEEFDISFNNSNEQINDSSFLKNIENEMTFIRSIIWTKNEELQKFPKVKKSRNQVVSLTCYFLHSLERKILIEIDNFFKSINRSFDVYIHDGGLLRKLKDEKEFPTDILFDLSKYIEKTTGFNLKFTNKEMKSLITQEELNGTIEIIQEHETFEHVKKQFEKYHFLYNGRVYKIGGTYIDNNDESINILTDILYTNQESKNEFGNIYFKEYDKKDNTKINEVEFFTKWIKHKERLSYNYFQFAPKQNLNEKIYNTFKGINIEKEIELRQNDLLEGIPTFENTKIYKYIYEIICDSSQQRFDFLMNIFYKIFFRPWVLSGVMIILYSERKGTGKSELMKFLRRLLGDELFVSVSKPELIFGKFNSLSANRLVSVFEESKMKSEFTGTMKDAITNEYVNIEKKGKDPITVKNSNQYFYLTNYLNDVIIETDCRRSIIFPVSEKEAQNKNYYQPVIDEMKNFKYQVSFYNYLEANYENEYEIGYFQENRPLSILEKQVQFKSECNVIKFFNYLVCYDDFPHQFYQINTKTKDIYETFLMYMKKDEREYSISTFGKKLSDKKFESFISKISSMGYTKYKIDKNKMYEYLLSCGYIDNDEN